MTTARSDAFKRLVLVGKLYERRSLILSLVESYMLNSSVATIPLRGETTDNAYTNRKLEELLFDEKEVAVRRTFIDILKKQQTMRHECERRADLRAASLEKVKQKFDLWTDQEILSLLSLMNDLVKQVQPFLVRNSDSVKDSSGDENRDDDDEDADVRVLADATLNGSPGNFQLLSEVYSTVLRLTV